MSLDYSNYFLIFKFLPYEDLLRISSVNKKFKGWAEDPELWRYKVIQRDFESKSSKPVLIRKYEDLPDSKSWKYIWNLLYVVKGLGSPETRKHIEILGMRG